VEGSEEGSRDGRSRPERHLPRSQQAVVRPRSARPVRLGTVLCGSAPLHCLLCVDLRLSAWSVGFFRGLYS